MHSPSPLRPYVLSRWSCPPCGVFECGTPGNNKAPASIDCPGCGKPAELKARVTGMTTRPLPFQTVVRLDQENDAQYYPRGGNRRSGKSTGRPRKIRPVETKPNPRAVRLPGDRCCAQTPITRKTPVALNQYDRAQVKGYDYSK